ncbi:hypothetical protein PC9H_004153 [Pleurotus ostreatus]|uniref:Uncharacterized protein n=2 Tax=Pleurotus ostreatus TaxID=5322 RepID=A0A8H7DUK1_PLEOS|nr:uncharacterized protein PC9H_004153 [Pleurotus ostreatus]KAF7437314.1 hypothetical protein PC9H_004153 [Pleurotus ostreatus]
MLRIPLPSTSFGLPSGELCPYNVTVDDRYGGPDGSEIAYGEGWFDSGLSECGPGCQSAASFAGATNGTWKRSTYDSTANLDKPKSASFAFNGTAVYVYCILAPATAAGIPGNTDLTFILDGNVAQMLKDLSLSPQRTVVFQQDNLPFGEHGLTIVNGHMGSKYKQVMVFLDSIVYTADDSQSDKGSRGKDKADRPRKGSNADGDNFASTQATSENKKLVIIAAICGVLGGILLLAILIWLYHRFRAKRTRQLPATPLPGMSSWDQDGFSRPPTSAPSWHPSLFVRQYPSAPPSRRAPSVTSSRRHILSSSSEDPSWRDMSVQDIVSEPDTSNASKSVHPGSMRQYEDPYSRRDPFVAVQQWQQRQSRVSSMESTHSPKPADGGRNIGPLRSPSILIQPPPLLH